MPYHHCPVCSHSGKSVPQFSTDDHLTISRCTQCRSAWLDPIPSRAEIRSFYPPEYYGARTSKFIAPIEHLLTSISARTIARASKKLGPGSRLLDIGCGRGLFLRELSKRVFEVHGTELNDLADESISDLCTIHVTDSLASLEFPENYFDMVLIWHVLEHLPDPKETISEISRILSPGGQLAVAVPNYGSLQSSISGRRWFHLDLPRHVFHFTPDGLRHLLQANGLRIKSTNHFSMLQNSFGWIQSILNRIPGLEVNCLYNLLHKRSVNISPRLSNSIAITHCFFAVLVFPFALLLTLIEGLIQNGGTIELLAEKTRP